MSLYTARGDSGMTDLSTGQRIAKNSWRVKAYGALDEFGSALGMAFQIRDDMLDVLSTNDELGKPVGSDAQENKNTYMALLGEDGCRETVDKLTAFAKSVLDEAFDEADFLKSLADQLANRKN